MGARHRTYPRQLPVGSVVWIRWSQLQWDQRCPADLRQAVQTLADHLVSSCAASFPRDYYRAAPVEDDALEAMHVRLHTRGDRSYRDGGERRAMPTR